MTSSHPRPVPAVAAAAAAAAATPAGMSARPAEPAFALVAHYTATGIEWRRVPVASLPVRGS
jgi:hypothetical protein